MKILVVEDHEEIWDFLSRRLRRRGFEVVVATDGLAGVTMSKNEAPDIVLLDMNLPVIDGWETVGILRADPATASLPIIALTAHAMSGDRERALAAGCTDYCPKPIDFSDLLSKINVYLMDKTEQAVEPLRNLTFDPSRSEAQTASTAPPPPSAPPCRPRVAAHGRGCRE